MFRRLRDTVNEVQGHQRLTRGTSEAIESGDQEARAAFTSGTGTLAAALTRRGCDTRGAEVCDYGTRVAAVGGGPERVHRLARD
ncbi:hypothetical protein AB0G74_16760 [Streptomyces sp. NPDC020875]|uniref:hypothetical protein n=1 Tax=Streptomyces sp. NPDC020875 TaxID=3154898 RepID=UPI0033E08F9D